MARNTIYRKTIRQGLPHTISARLDAIAAKIRTDGVWVRLQSGDFQYIACGNTSLVLAHVKVR